MRAWPECNCQAFGVWAASDQPRVMAWVCNIVSVVTIVTILHLRVFLHLDITIPYIYIPTSPFSFLHSLIFLLSVLSSTFLGLLFGWRHKDASSDGCSIYDLARLVRVEMADASWWYFAICFHDTCRCCHCREGQPLCKSICNLFALDAVKDRHGWSRFVSVLGRLICQQQEQQGYALILMRSCDGEGGGCTSHQA